MFVDQADIQVFGGDGGNGCVSMRKEKYVPQGGPDGGDGGDGGSVYLQASPGVDTLLDMVGRHHWYGKRGEHGMGKKMAGGDGADLVIRVPAGTLIYDADSGLLLADLKEMGQRVCVAKGGRGGKGNFQFITSVRQAPDFAEPGRKGEIRNLHLELRLIADVGFVGLPNAGKSTLLSRLSAARPKIADYPFTTLVPQIGIAALDAERRLVLADIPGLIEGASKGKGLGLDFLRHIERTRVVVHLVDILPLESGGGTVLPIDAYRQIRKELEAYSPKLAAKPEILIANKMDLAGAQEALADLRSELRGKQIFAVSAVTGTGLRPVLEAIWQQVQKSPPSEPFMDKVPVLAHALEEQTGPEFIYVGGEGAAEEWEPADGAEELVPEEPMKVERAKGNKRGKAVRTLIESDIWGKKRKKPRKSAASRKEAHEVRLRAAAGGALGERAKLEAGRARGAKAEAAKEQSAAKVAKRKSKAAAPDAELAAEIEAMKADDARKGKYYNRRKDV